MSSRSIQEKERLGLRLTVLSRNGSWYSSGSGHSVVRGGCGDGGGGQAQLERGVSGWMEPLRPFGKVCPLHNRSKKKQSLGMGSRYGEERKEDLG